MKKIFLSCVTREFGSYRLRLAEQLAALPYAGFDVKVQEDFEQGGFTLLDQLAAYVRDCDLVVHLVGSLCGARPTEQHVLAMFARLGGPVPELPPILSYTQWEYELARRFSRRMLCYVAEPEARRDCAPPDSPGCEQYEDDARLQAAHHARLQNEGKHYGTFAGHHDLVRTVFRDLGLSASDKANNLPFKSIGSLFKGRNEFLVKLRQTLGEAGHRGARRAAAITGAPTAAIYGLGGIGKTRTSVEFAHRYSEDYTALLFVAADSPSGLLASIAQLAGALILNLPEQDERETGTQVAAVLRWLRRYPGWILILDNVDSEEAAKAVDHLLGNLSGSGQLVITSRLSRWGGEIEPLELDLIDEDSASDYLLESTQKNRRKEPGDTIRAREIALELGRLALALEQAAASINATEWSLVEYQCMWRENRDRMMHWHDSLVTHYPKSVAITWLTSFEQLTENGRRLLRILAWFAPEPIPRSLMKTGGGPFAAAREGGAAKEEHYPELVLEAELALANLLTYSLAKSSADKLSFSVHRLVRDVTQRNLDENEQKRFVAAALRWVDNGFSCDPQDERNSPVLQLLSGHARLVAEQAIRRDIPEPIWLFLNRSGLFLRMSAQWSEAESLLRRSLEIAEQRFGAQDEKLVAILNNLAMLLHDTNHRDEAEPLMRRALAISGKSLGPDHPDVAIRLNVLASLLYKTNRLAEAEPHYRRALAISENSLGPEHRIVAAALHHLALFLQDSNRLAEAEPLNRRALDIDEKRYGPEHPNVATALNNLAMLLHKTNRWTEAEPHYRRALAINEKCYGPQHPEVAQVLNNLSEFLRATNRLDEAEPLMRRALAIFEKGYGPDHPSVATALNNLAILLHKTNRLTEAEPHYRRAIAISEKSYGPQHPDVATFRRNLNSLHQAMSRRE